ncbi:MAG: bile acid:sodium symporter [Deltaproteobacteria bacterium]|nr:bile acid:sodium symporter [Deltaproteobacteria bacterium]
MTFSDLLIIVVTFGSAALAVALPALGAPFQPYIPFFLMIMLFLSFLRIDFRALLHISSSSLLRLVGLTTVKLIILPGLLYWLTLLSLPEYSIPVLLLTGVSTGVVGPFIAGLVGAEMVLVLRMVIVTTLLVPFTLPPLVKLLAGAEVVVPLEMMIRLLAGVIFAPVLLVLFLRRYFPGVPERIAARQYPVSLFMFALINFGVFSKYSEFFFQNPTEILLSIGVAYTAAVIYYVTGFALSPGLSVPEKMAAAVSFGVMNNVLVIVFASRFFGPLAPTLATMYMFPFFTMIIPLRMIGEKSRAGNVSRGELS